MSYDVNGRDYRVYMCTECGRLVSRYEQNMTAHMRDGKDICFDCSFWLNLAAHPKEYAQVINGQYFTFPPVIKGSAKVRHILTHEGEIVSSTELYNYGHIPLRFIHLFPNTADFIGGSLLRKLRNNGCFSCKRLGCWDRLHCIWFREEQTDWNPIPKDHVVGEEMCPMFVNKFNPHNV